MKWFDSDEFFFQTKHKYHYYVLLSIPLFSFFKYYGGAFSFLRIEEKREFNSKIAIRRDGINSRKLVENFTNDTILCLNFMRVRVSLCLR